MVKLKFPKKSDYPEVLKLLNRSETSTEYLQLVEASASAYFETKGPAKWLFIKRFQVAKGFLEKIGPIKQLLDAGTGIGFFLPTLSQAADKVIGLDYSNYALKHAKTMCKKMRIKNVDFVQGDLLRLPFRKNQFDVIVALSILEHIPPNKLKLSMKHFKQVLKPGGYLIAGYPNEGNLVFTILKKLEKMMLRPNIFKGLRNRTSDYQPLGHVARSAEIDMAIDNYFRVIDNKALPGWGVKLYSIKLVKNG